MEKTALAKESEQLPEKDKEKETADVISSIPRDKSVLE